MPTTRDYEHLGKSCWRCFIHLDNGAETVAATLASVERPNKGLAKAWMVNNLGRHRRPGRDGRVWGEIEFGGYVDCSFVDAGFGRVLDAEWERDERAGSYLRADLAENGIDVEWSED